MVYPSLCLLPVPLVVFSVLHRVVLGPYKTIQDARRASEAVRRVVPPSRTPVTPQSLGWFYRHLRYRTCPGIACLEKSCALELWLAFHGQKSRVCLGRRPDGGACLMHAWVESGTVSFFEDARFIEIPL